MFLHYSDYGANCSDLSVHGGVFLPLITKALCAPLPDLSEVEGWENESERITVDPETRRRQSSFACGFVGTVLAGSWSYPNLLERKHQVLVDKLFHLNKYLITEEFIWRNVTLMLSCVKTSRI